MVFVPCEFPLPLVDSLACRLASACCRSFSVVEIAEEEESSRVGPDGRLEADPPGRTGRDEFVDRFEGPDGRDEAVDVAFESEAALTGVERAEGLLACPGLTGRPLGPVGTPFCVDTAGEEDAGPAGVGLEGPVGSEEDAAEAEVVEGFAGMEDLPVEVAAGAGEPAGVGEFDTDGWEGAREGAAEGALYQCFLRLAMTA